MPGGYLRTNWRGTNSGLAPTLFGRAVAKGSWYGSFGADYPNGGFVMGSFNGSSETGLIGVEGAGQGAGVIGYLSIDAMSIMNAFYGSDNGIHVPLGWGNSGYKIHIAQIHMFGKQAGSATAYDAMWASITTSDDSSIRFYAAYSTASAVTSASFSLHFVFAGFIVSGPNFPGNANP